MRKIARLAGWWREYQPGHGDDLSTWARTSLVVAIAWDDTG